MLGKLNSILGDVLRVIGRPDVVARHSTLVWKHLTFSPTSTQIANVLARCGQYPATFFHELQECTLNEIKWLRAKDIARITSAVCAFDREMSENFLDTVLNEFRSGVRLQEFEQHPTPLIELLYTLAVHDIYPDDLLDLCLSRDFLRRSQARLGGFTNSPLTTAFRLDCMLAIDRPNYAGNRLDAALMPNVKQSWPWIINGVRTKRERSPTRPVAFRPQRSVILQLVTGNKGADKRADNFRRRMDAFEGADGTYRDKFMLGAAAALCSGLGLKRKAENLVNVTAVMPHDLFLDVVLCMDSDGNYTKLNLPKWGQINDLSAWAVPVNEKRVLFTCALALCYEKPLNNLRPMAHWAARLRSLKKLGYTVIVLPRHHWGPAPSTAPTPDEMISFLHAQS